MKKSIKMMALGLAVIPCALVLTACGGTEDKDIVNIKGNYTQIENTEYSAVIEDIDAGFDLEDVTKGVKVLIDLDVSTTIAGVEVDLEMENEMIVKCPAVDGYINGKDLEMYNKSTIDAEMSMGDEKMDINGSAKLYMKDGIQYLDLSKGEDILEMMGSTNAPTKYYQQIVGNDAEPIAVPEFSLGDIFTQIPEGEWGQNIVISKDTSDTGYKLKVVAKSSIINPIIEGLLVETGVSVVFGDDIEMYLVYENNEFTGLYLDADATINVVFEEGSEMYQMFGPSLTVVADLNVQIAGYTGDIEYPSFKNYVDINSAE